MICVPMKPQQAQFLSTAVYFGCSLGFNDRSHIINSLKDGVCTNHLNVKDK